MTNNYILILCAFLLTTLSLKAQVDIISVDANYSKTTFYNVSTGETQDFDGDSWDLAFSNLSTQDAGILINEGSAFMGAALELYLAETTDWNETITDVSDFITENRLLNPDVNWTDGAFNSVRDSLNPFDYGWGVYSPMTNSVTGNKVYVLKKRNGTFVKMYIQSLLNNTYSFVVANLDGSNETTYSVDKDSDNNQGVFFFSLETNSVLDVTIDFDLIFGRYSALVFGQGVFQEYIVTGILTAPNVEVAEADEIDPLVVQESEFSDQYTSSPREIGSDWKYFDFAAGWVIEDDRAYFIKAKSGDTYKIVFYDFEGSSTGNATLEKFNLGTTSAIFEEEYEALTIYPNPSHDYFVIEADQINELDVTIYSQTGSMIFEGKLQNQRFDIPATWNTGIYYVVAKGENVQFRNTILIQR